MKSPIYWHPKLYSIVIRIIEGKDFKRRYDRIKEEVKDFNVLDLGCADCYLSNLIKREKYYGIDINKKFIAYSKKKGIKAEVLDIRKNNIPPSECIILSNILHQVYPHHEEILKKCLKSSSKKVIIAEHLNHMASSKNHLISYLARILNDPGYRTVRKRLDKEELFEIYKKFNVSKLEVFGNISIAVFNKSNSK